MMNQKDRLAFIEQLAMTNESLKMAMFRGAELTIDTQKQNVKICTCDSNCLCRMAENETITIKVIYGVKI
jgi:hypothetical protein